MELKTVIKNGQMLLENLGVALSYLLKNAFVTVSLERVFVMVHLLKFFWSSSNLKLNPFCQKRVLSDFSLFKIASSSSSCLLFPINFSLSPLTVLSA